MSGPEPTNGTLGYRMNAAERRLDRLESFEPAVLIQRINDLHDDNTNLRNEVVTVRREFTSRVQSLQNRILGLALAIAAGSITILITQSGVLN